ncbi:AraC family transcriptional regulator [Thalassotalea hakodatensis]|uniref:AraC family transcriptional regulator n=1 Tax=Thalassotalea hakodatensis TaxID=3030492 RepID=UPI002574171C|nr:AraC family transcriptional regulator [Thalassotalea hakodatensis]
MEPTFENVQTNEGSSFCCFKVKCHDLNEDHSWHFHPEYELVWNISGEGTRFVGDSVDTYLPGDMILIGPNVPHCWQSSTNKGHKESELLVIQFKPSCFGDGFLQLPEAGLISRLLDNASKGLEIFGETSEKIAKQLSFLYQQQSIDRLLCLIKILDQVANSDDVKVLTTPEYDLHSDINNTNLRRIETIYSYVRANLGDDINQTEIANKVGLTTQGFSRFFKKYTGLTFVKFVNTLRVNEACRLLVRENYDVTQIAYMCGYQNISNFNRRFQEIKSLTPSEFRSGYRQGNKVPYSKAS